MNSFTPSHITPPYIQAVTYQQTGIRNLQNQRPCEDVLHILETPNFCFYGLADGQSGKSRSISGGLLCLKSTMSYIQRQGINNLVDCAFPDELPCMLMKAIRGDLLQRAVKENIVFTEYSSTLLAAAIDPVSGQFLLTHLGDGCALGVTHEDSVIILSPPDTGIMSDHTWLTTAPNAVHHLQITFGSILDKKKNHSSFGWCSQTVPKQKYTSVS